MRSKKIRLVLIGGLTAATIILGLLILVLVQEQSQPKSDEKQMPTADGLFSLEKPDCALPCLLGVTPGETDVREARTILSAYSVATPEPFDHDIDIQCDAKGCIHVELGAPDPRLGSYVSRMTLMVDRPEKLTTLGEMLEKGYTPQRVFRRSVAGPNAISLIVVFTGDATIIADVGGSAVIDSNSSIRFLTIVAEQDLDRTLNDIYLRGRISQNPEIPWLGYAPIEDYWNAPLLHPEG